jgi:P27 family predicted phage terminase small subunit
MGRRGPPPLPTALKKARGTFQPCRAPEQEMVPTPGAPPCPADLDKIARAKWDEIVPQLMEQGVLSTLDGQILEAYCRSYSLWKVYALKAEKAPMIKTPFGPKVNPAAAEARKWETLVNQCGDRLGLSPSARTRVGVPKKPDAEDAKTKAAKFLFGGPLAVVKGGKDG